MGVLGLVCLIVDLGLTVDLGLSPFAHGHALARHTAWAAQLELLCETGLIIHVFFHEATEGIYECWASVQTIHPFHAGHACLSCFFNILLIEFKQRFDMI